MSKIDAEMVIGWLLLASVPVLAGACIYGIWWDDWRPLLTATVIASMLVVFAKIENEVRR